MLCTDLDMFLVSVPGATPSFSLQYYNAMLIALESQHKQLHACVHA
jgi:hypothetical protein